MPAISVGISDQDGFTTTDARIRRRLLRRVAEAGLDHVTMGDHVSFHGGAGFDGMVTASTLLASHDSLPVLIGVYLLGLRHPMLAARQLSTLAQTAPGRLTLGVGVAGEDRAEVRNAGVDPATRGRRLDEALPLVRRLLAGEEVTFSGEFFRLEAARILPAPQPPVPIVIGGKGDAAVRRTAELGDGWLGMFCSARRFAETRQRIVAAAADHGRPAPGWFGVSVWCGLDGDASQARDLVAARMEGLYRLPYEKFQPLAPAGTPKQVAEFLYPYVESGARHVTLIPAGRSIEAEIDAVAEVSELLRAGRADEAERAVLHERGEVTVRAVVMRAYGDPSVLSEETVPDPAARPGHVLVRLEAAALNWHDVLVRRGQYGSPLPHVPGADGAGTRVDTGERVVILPSLSWGEREAAPGPDWEILGDHRWGTYAELVSVPADCVLPWPAGFDAPQAAALPLTGLTVYRALFVRGRLARGESLLVLGASGGVATMAVSLASAAGARVVVTSSSKSKIEAARDLGATGGVDHGQDGWTDQAREMTVRGAGFDLVLDSVGRWAESVACLRPGGRCVVLGASARDQATLDVRPFYFGQYELIGTTMGSPADLAGLLSFLAGHLVPPPVIDQVFPLEQAAAAHRRLESAEGFGKIVLRQR